MIGKLRGSFLCTRVVPLINLRTIDLISCLPIIERIVHKRLVDYLEEHRLLSNQQFGFRRKRSTELPATLFLDDIRRSVDSKKLVGCVFIDFSKAFDTLSHSKLLSKLTAYGITDNELEWFTSYLFQRRQLIQYNDKLSKSCPVTCGVPQGSILGPLLFVIFANDIMDHVNNSKIIMYADDTVLYTDGQDLK
jgi:hypothetical protein